MKIKNIIHIISFVLLVVNIGSCSSEAPYDTISPNDIPRILSPSFPDRTNGELATYANITRDADFAMDVVATPSDYVTIKWLIDDEEVGTGASIDKQLLAGTYNLKIVVTTTQGKSTSREGKILVRPLDDDPWSTASELERLVAPGSQATLVGINLEKVKTLEINGNTLPVTYDATSGHLYYTVPANLSDGNYRIVLVDADGQRFGGDLLTVTSEAWVTTAQWHTHVKDNVTLTGLNLDKVKSLIVGDRTTTDFVRQSETTLTFTCPDLEDA